MSANNDIYKHFNINYDNNHNIINNNIFNLKYYQTLPKYYILDNNIQTLLLDYGMGTEHAVSQTHMVLGTEAEIEKWTK